MKYLKLSSVLLALLLAVGCGSKSADTSGKTTTKTTEVEQQVDDDNVPEEEESVGSNDRKEPFVPVPGDEGSEYGSSGYGDDDVDANGNDSSGQYGSNDVDDENNGNEYGDSMARDSSDELDENGELAAIDSLRAIYFDFDKYDIRDDMKPYVRADAKFIKEQDIKSVILQGNTDEFGTDEYNFALGQKRAVAVREALVLQGLPRNMFSTISYGASKPVCKEKVAECYAKNRRTELVEKQ